MSSQCKLSVRAFDYPCDENYENPCKYLKQLVSFEFIEGITTTQHLPKVKDEQFAFFTYEQNDYIEKRLTYYSFNWLPDCFLITLPKDSESIKEAIEILNKANAAIKNTNYKVALVDGELGYNGDDIVHDRLTKKMYLRFTKI